MARMYPPRFHHFSEADTGAVGEQLVYNALSRMPEDWVVIHNCWRHVLINRNDSDNDEHRCYEADFILLIPGCGIMVLEVKNWQLAKVENGQWLRCESDDGKYSPVKHGSPLNQAFLACGSLQKELKKHFRWGRGHKTNMEFRCMAVLLGKMEQYIGMYEVYDEARVVDMLQNTPCYRSTPRNEVYDRLYLCGTDELEHHLQKRIKDLFCFNNPTTAEELDDVRRYLLQNLELRLDAGTINSIITTAAAPLLPILPMLEQSRHGIHVHGCAGSAKSHLLCTEAARIVQEKLPSRPNLRVLILCFNLNLAEHLRSHQSLQSAGVEPYNATAPLVLDNFHTVANAICRQEALPGASHHSSFPPEQLATLQQCISANPAAYGADYIFVDEAQDFRPEWWPVVQVMLRPGGKLYLFSDTGQTLYHHAPNTMPALPVQLRLTCNLRNSGPIARFASAISADGAKPLPLPGPEVQIMPASDDFDTRAATVKQAIQNLLADNYEKQDIVVLTPWRRKNSLKSPLLADWVDFPQDGETRENAAQRLQACRTCGATRILGETIKAFKGLESFAVILADISEPKDTAESGFTTQELYVACTRARYRLIIVPTCSGAAYLRNKQLTPAPQHEQAHTPT